MLAFTQLSLSECACGVLVCQFVFYVLLVYNMLGICVVLAIICYLMCFSIVFAKNRKT